MGWNELAVLFCVAAVLSSAGFYKFIYFISIGYGLSVTGIGAAIMIMFAGKTDAPCYLLCALLICYGLRLAGYLFIRELKSASYRKTLKQVSSEYKKRNLVQSVGVWIAVCALYVAQTSPVFYLASSGGGAANAWAGAAICAIALILESVADLQKSRQKKLRPDMVATEGLYRYVRCPNYFAEILFWTGVLISGFGSFGEWGRWVMALAGYVSIVFIMFNGAYRMEKRQNKTYGEKPEYVSYVSKTPIIIPFVPLYHLTRKKA